jgi:divalent metal cation (Fe/Co/Zn/Cd) transporter
MAIGVLLIVVAVFVAIEVKALLIGQGVDPLIDAEMRSHLSRQPEVAELLNLLTMQLGDRVMVAVKARIAPAASAEALIDSINRVEAGFRQRFPEVLWLFFEPDHER